MSLLTTSNKLSLFLGTAPFIAGPFFFTAESFPRLGQMPSAEPADPLDTSKEPGVDRGHLAIGTQPLSPTAQGINKCQHPMRCAISLIPQETSACR